MQKSVPFLYTDNEQSKNEIKKAIVSKRILRYEINKSKRRVP